MASTNYKLAAQPQMTDDQEAADRALCRQWAQYRGVEVHSSSPMEVPQFKTRTPYNLAAEQARRTSLRSLSGVVAAFAQTQTGDTATMLTDLASAIADGAEPSS